MKNYTKNMVPVASKAFAFFLIISILLPAPFVTTVYAQTADDSAVVTAVPSAEPVDAVTSVKTATEDMPVVEVSSGGSSVSVNPATSNRGGNPSCAGVDANHDGLLNNADFVTFTTLYTAHDPAGDFNHDGQYNVVDFQDFLNAFSHCSGTGSISICTRADMTNDGQLNGDDFTAFQEAFDTQMPRADFDQNGFYNTNDFQAFTNAYAGCTHPVLPTVACALVDMNGDGVLNAADFAAFETAFNNSDPRTDFDHNGFYNANDFQAYTNAFAECGGNGSLAPTLCARADMNNDHILSPDDFTAFETAYNNHDAHADFDLNGNYNANDFQAFINAYAACPHGTTTPPNGNITVSPISGTTTEVGGTVVISVALGSTPTAPVTINLSSNDTTEGTVSTGTLTLDASHMAQSFIVTGVDDAQDDGDVSYAIVFAPTISTDSNYNGLHVNNVALVNTDNDEGETGGGGGGGGGNGGGGGGSFSSSSGGTGFAGGIGGGEVLGAATTNVCNYLNSFLKRGDKNDMIEVMKLQSFLQTSQGFSNVTVNGIFDDATFNAVQSFQQKYGSDVLSPWGYSNDEATGYVYILTKKKVNEIFCRNQISLTPAEQSEISSFRASKSLAMTDEGSVKKN